jgi:hypothetical protein
VDPEDVVHLPTRPELRRLRHDAATSRKHGHRDREQSSTDERARGGCRDTPRAVISGARTWGTNVLDRGHSIRHGGSACADVLDRRRGIRTASGGLRRADAFDAAGNCVVGGHRTGHLLLRCTQVPGRLMTWRDKATASDESTPSVATYAWALTSSIGLLPSARAASSPEISLPGRSLR